MGKRYERSPYVEAGIESRIIMRQPKARLFPKDDLPDFTYRKGYGNGHRWNIVTTKAKIKRGKEVCYNCEQPKFAVESKKCTGRKWEKIKKQLQASK